MITRNLNSFFLLAASAALVACANGTPRTTAVDPDTSQEAFFDAFRPYCGKAYAARIVEDSHPSPAWDQALIVHVRDCEAGVIRMPLHVGADRSRTWVLTRHDGFIDFQHYHLHADGSPDAVSPYGGQTRDAGTATRQSFPVDDTSKALFMANGLDVSVTNVWSIELRADQTMTYSLSRPGRTFEVEVNLAEAVPLPPPAWGYAGR